MAHDLESSPNVSKVFVGGLKDISKEDLIAHFSQFGEFLKDMEVVNDQNTGAAKFAFITYKNVADSDNCIKSNTHYINKTKLTPRLAVNKELNLQLRELENEGQAGNLNVFIGGLPPSADEDMVKNSIESHHGNIKVKKVIIKKRKEDQKPRGFGFLTLEHDHDVAKACEIRHFIIDGKKVECKLAPKNRGGQTGGFRGGRGGGQERGGYGGYSSAPAGRGRGSRGGGSGGWQEGYQGGSSGYGTGYESWGNEGYDENYYQDNYYSQNGSNYDNYNDYYGSGSGSDYYGSEGGYGNSQGGYGGGRGGRGRGGASGYGGARGAAGRGGTRGRGAPRYQPY